MHYAPGGTQSSQNSRSAVRRWVGVQNAAGNLAGMIAPAVTGSASGIGLAAAGFSLAPRPLRQPNDQEIVRHIVDDGEVESVGIRAGIDAECAALARVHVVLANELSLGRELDDFARVQHIAVCDPAASANSLRKSAEAYFVIMNVPCVC